MKDSKYKLNDYTVYTYDCVDSTNDICKRAISAMGTLMDKTVHVAGEQTQGKGRRGRTWLNSDGAIYMSLIRVTRFANRRIPTIGLAAAAAVRNVLTRMTEGRLAVSIKWPNDIITTDRMEKLCGILSESVIVSKDKYVIIGIGINLNAVSMPEGLLQPATSVYLSCGIRLDILETVDEIIKEFDVQYKLLQLHQNEFLEIFSRNCITLSRHVVVSDANGVRYGVGEKLTGEGCLIVRFEDGTTEAVYAADVSIRNSESMTDALALKLRPKRRADSNKGHHGRALIIAGSDTMPGAALMCTKACIRAGAGLTKALIVPAAAPSFALVPEAMLYCDDGKADELIEWAGVILIGCGMGVSERTRFLLEKTLLSRKPCVIDADGLNTLAKYRELMDLLHENAVLTPHPAEFSRLSGMDIDSILHSFTVSATDFAAEHNCCVLLKSSSSIIVSPDGRVRYNDTGSSALAKGGSGDVLAGLITGYAAQGLKPFNAASLGAYSLGLSAEKALEFLNNRYIAAGDIIDMIAADLGTVNEKEEQKSIPERKAELRKILRAKRREITDEQRSIAAEKVAEKLCSIDRLRGAKYVLAYMAMKYELDVSPAVKRLGDMGVKIVYPLCIENGGLRLLIPEDENGFVTGSYGILEPDPDRSVEIPPSRLDAIILPAIGFDTLGRRLGQGGGYYDRLLAVVDCFKAAVGFDCQLVESVPTEQTDKRVDCIVTPSVTLMF